MMVMVVVVMMQVILWFGTVRWCMVWCGSVVRCGVVWCGVVWCDVVWCGSVRRGAVRCGVARQGVLWGHEPPFLTLLDSDQSWAGRR